MTDGGPFQVYAFVTYQKNEIFRTKIIESVNPEWNEQNSIPL
jgi:hypothetical protein